MPSFSSTSREKLATADPRLQSVFNEVIKYFDCVILCGIRSKAEQDAAVKAGNSKTPYPESKHNPDPRKAVDAGPFDRKETPIDWMDRERMTYFAGHVIATARSMGIKVRWGGDWDQDTRVKDNSFDDLVHFELVD